MNCAHCTSDKIVKNGHRKGKQSYLCRDCRHQFRDKPQPGYTQEVKALCVTMSLNGMGFRASERVTGINHNSVINWVRPAAAAIPDENYEIPETAQLDELETFVGQKNKIWWWTVVNTKYPGILKCVVGDHSRETLKPLWPVVMGWACFLYITAGYKVYPCVIEAGDHLVSKTAMTRVEGANCRLRHYLARLHRKTLCYSKSVEKSSSAT
ncbi:Mobile element protein [uncultured Synechococcales cyanobacterium]|uniref:Mobile element protein n=1 Tax=uncultured Synechococcales cyanobacterium TaxID=1936017 RepID=A0A6N3IPJ1_9CYAN|nr:Mobile element protein [uncultured Synechococcales cyanobacterium]